MSVRFAPGIQSPRVAGAPRRADLRTRAARVLGAPAGAAKVADFRIGTKTVPYLDRGEHLLLSEMQRQGVPARDFKATELRGLGALLGKGLVPVATLPEVVTRLAKDKAALPTILEANRDALMARITQDHGIKVKDYSSRWTVQELANLDYMLGEFPPGFKAVVASGPALVREKSNDMYTGVYRPAFNDIRYSDDFNYGGQTLDAVHRSEFEMRGTLIMEMTHAWQFRKASVLGLPLPSMVVKGLAGYVYGPPDFGSEWARISGWTVRPKTSLWSLIGRQTPNMTNGSGALKDISFSLFGKQIRFSLNDLKYDPAKDKAFVSEYARFDPYEDLGESAIAYFTDPAVLEKVSPEKYAYIKRTLMEGKEFENSYGLF